MSSDCYFSHWCHFQSDWAQISRYFILSINKKNIFRQPKYDDFPPSVARQFTSELSTSQCYASCSAKSIPLMGLSIKMSVSTLIQIAVCLLLLPWPVLILHEMLVKHSTPWYTRWWVIVSLCGLFDTESDLRYRLTSDVKQLYLEFLNLLDEWKRNGFPFFQRLYKYIWNHESRLRTCGMHVFDAKKSSYPDTRQN